MNRVRGKEEDPFPSLPNKLLGRKKDEPVLSGEGKKRRGEIKRRGRKKLPSAEGAQT